MALCEEIAAKIVAEEGLNDQEQTHLETCSECRDFRQSALRLAGAFNQMRSIDAPRADDVEKIKTSLSERMHSYPQQRVRMLRLSFATMALVCVGLIGVWLWGSRGPSEEDAELSATHLLALLDEVDSMYTSTTEVAAQYPVQALQVLSESGTEISSLEESDLGVMLPGAYNSLYEWFSDRS
jgi:predicted anti-sigma-YlaC factor YlaD